MASSSDPGLMVYNCRVYVSWVALAPRASHHRHWESSVFDCWNRPPSHLSMDLIWHGKKRAYLLWVFFSSLETWQEKMVLCKSLEGGKGVIFLLWKELGGGSLKYFLKEPPPPMDCIQILELEDFIMFCFALFTWSVNPKFLQLS